MNRKAEASLREIPDTGEGSSDARGLRREAGELGGRAGGAPEVWGQVFAGIGFAVPAGWSGMGAPGECRVGGREGASVRGGGGGCCCLGSSSPASRSNAARCGPRAFGSQRQRKSLKTFFPLLPTSSSLLPLLLPLLPAVAAAAAAGAAAEGRRAEQGSERPRPWPWGASPGCHRPHPRTGAREEGAEAGWIWEGAGPWALRDRGCRGWGRASCPWLFQGVSSLLREQYS